MDTENGLVGGVPVSRFSSVQQDVILESLIVEQAYLHFLFWMLESKENPWFGGLFPG